MLKFKKDDIAYYKSDRSFVKIIDIICDNGVYYVVRYLGSVYSKTVGQDHLLNKEEAKEYILKKSSRMIKYIEEYM